MHESDQPLRIFSEVSGSLSELSAGAKETAKWRFLGAARALIEAALRAL